MSIWNDEMLSKYVTLRHYDPDVDAVWSIDEEANDSLQIVYERKGLPDQTDQSFWLYLTPHSASIIGNILLQWAEARK